MAIVKCATIAIAWVFHAPTNRLEQAKATQRTIYLANACSRPAANVGVGRCAAREIYPRVIAVDVSLLSAPTLVPTRLPQA